LKGGDIYRNTIGLSKKRLNTEAIGGPGFATQGEAKAKKGINED